jgi:hypothetical protein
LKQIGPSRTGHDQREEIMTWLAIVIVAALIAFVIAAWRIKRPPPGPPVS